MVKNLINFILPPRCLCGKKIIAENNSICVECYSDCGIITSSTCGKCGNPLKFDFGESTLCAECISKEPEYHQGRFVFEYNPFSARIITRLKYGDKTQSVKKLAEFMNKKISSFDTKPDIISSIPITKKKLIHRKFNQSALLANEISKISEIPVDNHILYRIKNVPPQASLKRKERLTNMKNVFKVNDKKIDYIKDRSILLVDDVQTTGATLDEATTVLKRLGASKVYALTFAKTFISENTYA